MAVVDKEPGGEPFTCISCGCWSCNLMSKQCYLGSSVDRHCLCIRDKNACKWSLKQFTCCEWMGGCGMLCQHVKFACRCDPKDWVCCKSSEVCCCFDSRCACPPGEIQPCHIGCCNVICCGEKGSPSTPAHELIRTDASTMT